MKIIEEINSCKECPFRTGKNSIDTGCYKLNEDDKYKKWYWHNWVKLIDGEHYENFYPNCPIHPNGILAHESGNTD